MDFHNKKIMKLSTITLVFTLFLVVGCSQLDNRNAEPSLNRERDNANVPLPLHDGLSDDLEIKIRALEMEFASIREHNFEVSPQSYAQITAKLDELKESNDARVQRLRDELALLKVGGMQQGQNVQPQEQGYINKNCQGSGPVVFTYPPMDLDDIETILPLGMMIGGHVTPIDHGYFTAKSWEVERNDPAKFVNVYAPADGFITASSMPSEFMSSEFGDYYITLHYTCTFYSIFIHVNVLSEKLQAIADTKQAAQVKAGEVIGQAPGFDFAVQNDEVVLPGFIVPEHYEVEPAKIHTVSMFDHFQEPLRSQLLEKNVRQKEPRSGKIDYDIDGYLVGNWFEEGTNGYRGKEEYHSSIGYWATHLSFAYDGLDPDLVIVSIGDFDSQARQFAVKGNAPDPKDVSVSSGLVTYELVGWQYLTSEGKEWDRISFAKVVGSKRYEDSIKGVVLVQMLDDRKIKFEAFPGKKASEVSGFSSNAKIYER